MEHNRAQWSINGHNKENFGALLKNIIGNLKSIIGSGLLTVTKYRTHENFDGAKFWQTIQVKATGRRNW